MDQRRGDRGGDQERDDGEKLAGDAVIMGDQFGAGDDEAAGDLGAAIKTWMPGTRAGMTSSYNLALKRGDPP